MYRLALTATVAAGFWVANASAALPYQWTPAQVAKATGSTRCTVVLQAFKCVNAGKPLFVKIRPWGAGLVCKSRLSVSRIPTKCLAPPAVDEQDPASFVRVAIQQKVDPHPDKPAMMWQSFQGSCRGSRGVYTCTSVGSVAMTAQLVYKPSGQAHVTFTAFQCAPDVQAWRPDGCRFP